MPTELEWQRRIIKSAKKQGGYGKKWASQFIVGAPDLVLSFPQLGPLFMEVKLLRDVNQNIEWQRKLEVTKKQRHELQELRNAGADVLIGAVVEFRDKDVVLIGAPISTETLYFDDPLPYTEWYGIKHGFNLIRLIGECRGFR